MLENLRDLNVAVEFFEFGAEVARVGWWRRKGVPAPSPSAPDDTRSRRAGAAYMDCFGFGKLAKADRMSKSKK